MVAGKKITIISENLAWRLVHRPPLNAKSRLKQMNKQTQYKEIKVYGNISVTLRLAV